MKNSKCPGAQGDKISPDSDHSAKGKSTSVLGCDGVSDRPTESQGLPLRMRPQSQRLPGGIWGAASCPPRAGEIAERSGLEGCRDTVLTAPDSFPAGGACAIPRRTQ